MAGAVIQSGSRIGINSIINTRASVDHDCVIGNHVHISPGVTLSGGVEIGTCSHIGTGSTVIQGIVIGNSCLAAAGAVVTKDVIAGVKVRGVPAREFA
jgi:UDP-perosamine 4-acetyltransferase